MIGHKSLTGDKFQEFVGIKFQLYNSLFLSLPFYGVDRTGILLSLFSEACDEGFSKGKSPTEIVEGFLKQYGEVDLLFRFVQYAERQVVLFDALEDAAFRELHDMDGKGTISHLLASVEQTDNFARLKERLAKFSIRLVLTAHPTQFYPGTVLGIINDLEPAINSGDIPTINLLLQQLGRTPFFKKSKPTPVDEAASQIWYLENVFYAAVGAIQDDLRPVAKDLGLDLNDLIRIGFWSGGDRDGNPFVTSETTLQVGRLLRKAIVRCYHRDIRRLKRRLTFAGVESAIADLESLLYHEAFVTETATLSVADIEQRLISIRALIAENHDGLFIETVDSLLDNVRTFGLHFASLDIRQEAAVHTSILSELIDGYASMTAEQKIDSLLGAGKLTAIPPDGITADTLATVNSIATIQAENGVKGCERYIISQCRGAVNVIEVMGLFLLAGWKKEQIDIDVVPLFETIDDLEHAEGTMRQLYEMPQYRDHLRRRADRQTIMLGFSDGTKDGGYLMANWSIYKAKDRLTRLAAEFDICVVFFDGRGGPPARGGGRTHRFYASMGRNIANDRIEVTVQGQTVSSNFGTKDAAKYNIEQLVNAGLHDPILSPRAETFSAEEFEITERLAQSSFDAYVDLKGDPDFMKYLSDVSPMRFYAQANIGSRPAKRGQGELTLNDLRAIPFVGAWSQIKQNVPGFYGVGSALQALEPEIERIAQMYGENAFFKTLIDNCEMAMQKTHFGLTAFLEHDPAYGAIWSKIRDEFDRTLKYVSKITGTSELMSDTPVEQRSVRTREKIVLPLVTIQQFALTKLREATDSEKRKLYEKLVIRCSFGIINAGRNSA
ncbi:MAG: phosphoenolpyruvate carboxylase [Pyrinomonadaceae bacterium]